MSVVICVDDMLPIGAAQGKRTDWLQLHIIGRLNTDPQDGGTQQSFSQPECAACSRPHTHRHHHIHAAYVPKGGPTSTHGLNVAGSKCSGVTPPKQRAAGEENFNLGFGLSKENLRAPIGFPLETGDRGRGALEQE